MISVLSLLQQLSGSKFIFLLCFGLLFTSCGILEELFDGGRHDDHVYVPRDRDRNQDRGDENVDTIVVEKVENPDKISDIDIEENSHSRHKSHYTIGIILPFVNDSGERAIDGLSAENEYYMQYYLGALMAAEKLTQGGDFSLEIVSRKADRNMGGSLFKDKLERIYEEENCDVIIGGSSRDQVEVMAEFAKERECLAISPFVPHNNVTRNNPYFIQLAPPLDAYLEAIVTDIYAHRRNADVVLIGEDDFKSRFAIIQEYRKALYHSPINWKEIILGDKGDVEQLKLDDISSRSKNRVFIIPMDYDKIFIYKILTKLFSLPNSDEIIVYGLPPWDRFTILYQFFKNVDVYIPAMNYIDKESDAFKAFRKEYYEKYNAIPDVEAVKGYDEILFIGKMLQRDGIPFTYSLPEIEYQGLSSFFKFQDYSMDKNNIMGGKKFNYMVNRGLLMWKLSP